MTLISIVTRLRSGRGGSLLGRGGGKCFFSSPPNLAPIQSFTQCVPAVEADNSLPSTVEVTNAWSCTSNLPFVIMAWYLVENLGNFTLSFVIASTQYSVTLDVSCAIVK